MYCCPVWLTYKTVQYILQHLQTNGKQELNYPERRIVFVIRIVCMDGISRFDIRQWYRIISGDNDLDKLWRYLLGF